AAVAFIDRTGPPTVQVQLLDPWGNRDSVVDVSDGAHPIFEANPVITGVTGGFVIAFNDFSGPSGLGIALRRLNLSGPSLSPVLQANLSTIGAQFDPDLI